MIRYSLKCTQGHEFESWFRDSDAYDALVEAGQVTCAICGKADISKTVMAPSVSNGGGKKQRPLSTQQPPDSPAGALLRKLSDMVRRNADYVGKEFAVEARRINTGEAEERGIWGEATPQDAKALIEEGIAVAPIPWMSRRND